MSCRNFFVTTRSGTNADSGSMIVWLLPRISHQRVKDGEADDDGLDEKEDGVEFVIALIARDGRDG